jgi:hypothetical protein
MKVFATAAGFLAGAISFAVLCRAEPPARVVVPGPEDPGAYQPLPMPKPLPMEPPPPPQGQPMPNASIRNEDAFLQAYAARRNPRMMVFVNRTIAGDAKDGPNEVQRIEERHSATGAVDVKSQDTRSSSAQSTGAGYGGASASNSHSRETSGSSFTSQGPADYSKTTSVKVAQDKYDSIGASNADYEMIEVSLVKYFDNSGKVQIQDAEAARMKLDREKVLRIENGDPAAVRLLATELGQDILIRVTAEPTSHSDKGPAVRILAKSVSTTDARMLGMASVDMPLPMSKQNINVYTRYLAGELMGEMTKKWAGSPDASPVEVRIYKTAGVDDTLKIKKWLQATKGVQSVITRSATGGSTTSYASFAVGYAGAPEDLYADLKDAIGISQGLKAVDVQSTTINLEVTGVLNLVTTTRKSETITTTTTNVVEENKVEPINPAPPQIPETPAPQPQ